VSKPKPITSINTTGGLVRHYVYDQPGIIARTFMPGLVVEVALWRGANKYPTYQGTVTRHRGDGRYTATTPAGEEVTTTALNYIDAEQALLCVRTGRRSHAGHDWPGNFLGKLRARHEKPTCRECGHEFVNGTCRRLDLHW
jgi:hypothetical protein